MQKEIHTLVCYSHKIQFSSEMALDAQAAPPGFDPYDSEER